MNLPLFLLSLAWLVAISSAETIYEWKPASGPWDAYPAGGEHLVPIPAGMTPDKYNTYYLARAKVTYNRTTAWHIGKYNKKEDHFTALLDDEYIWSTNNKADYQMFHHKWTVFSWIRSKKADTMKEAPNYGGKIPGCEEFADICRTLRSKLFTYGPATNQTYRGVIPGYVREGRCHYEWKGVRFHEPEYEVLRINQMGLKRREFLN